MYSIHVNGVCVFSSEHMDEVKTAFEFFWDEIARPASPVYCGFVVFYNQNMFPINAGSYYPCV